MKNLMSKIMTWSLIFLMTLGGVILPTKAMEQKGGLQVYEYPVRPGSNEWSKLQGHQEMIDCCQLPDKWLKKDTITLLASVLQYPLLADIYAWTTFEDGLSHVASYFNGLQELLTRNDLILAAKRIAFDALEYECDYEEEIAKQTLLLLQNYPESLSEMVGIQAVTASQVTNNNVTTPNGTQVPHYENLTWSDHGVLLPGLLNSVENSYISMYSLTTVLPRNPSYNCHSFAWYSSYINPYWINNPIYYWNDGSFYQVYSAVLGYRLVYYNAAETIPYVHSAICYSSGSSPTVQSKWGYLGAYQHNAQNCPYYVTGTSFRYYTRDGEK